MTTHDMPRRAASRAGAHDELHSRWQQVVGRRSFLKRAGFPRPCELIDKDLPDCSIIRPTPPQDGGAMAAVKFLTTTGLFQGQSSGFFTAATQLAQAADAAARGL